VNRDHADVLEQDDRFKSPQERRASDNGRMSRRTMTRLMGSLFGPFLLPRRETAADTQVAEREPVSYDVRDFGAAGDGVRDDTAAIQRALTKAGGLIRARTAERTASTLISGGVTDTGVTPARSAGGIVHLPRGQYRISSSLYVPANCSLSGIGRGSVLRHFGARAAICAARPADKDGYAFGIILRDFMIFGNPSLGASQHGIHLQYASFGLIENVVVEECGGNGIYINDHTVGMDLRSARCRDCGLSQLLFDGVPEDGSTYQNCDSHKVSGGLYQCNKKGQFGIRLRATADIYMAHPQLEGMTTSGSALRLEGATDTQIDGSFVEQWATHLSIDEDNVTRRRSARTLITGGDWECGSGALMNLQIDNANDTVLSDVHYNRPPAGANGVSIISIGPNAVDTLIRGRCETLGLSDSGLNTRLDDYITAAPSAQGVAGHKNPNLITNPNDLAATGWERGANLTLSLATGPLTGVDVLGTRLESIGSTNNAISFQSSEPSKGSYHCLSLWARLVSGPAYMSAHITVPGVAEEVVVPLSLGTSFKRYVVQGPLGSVGDGTRGPLGAVACAFIIPKGTTVELAGVKLERGGSTPL
jgi:hypothetical protein